MDLPVDSADLNEQRRRAMRIRGFHTHETRSPSLRSTTSKATGLMHSRPSFSTYILQSSHIGGSRDAFDCAQWCSPSRIESRPNDPSCNEPVPFERGCLCSVERQDDGIEYKNRSGSHCRRLANSFLATYRSPASPFPPPPPPPHQIALNAKEISAVHHHHSVNEGRMKTEAAILASSVIALVAVLAASSTIAAPMEKRLMMALSLQASPTVAEIDLGGLLPTPTVPPIAGEIANIFTSVADGVTGLIPTTIPSPTLPDLLPDLTVSVAIAAPTAPPEAQVLGLLAQKALNAVPTLLIQNLVQIQSEFSAALASIATATPTPLVYVATENGAEVTRTSTPTLPSFAANGVINPLSVLANALPRPTDFVQEVTSVIGGVTSVLQLPALPLPTDLIPLLGTMQLPQLDVPGLLGDKQHLCVKDGNGHQLGLCENGPIINDSEVIAI